MAYIPNPDDATQPTGNVVAQTAAAEFRALKGKVNGIQAATGTKIPVRQSVLAGPVLAGLPSDIILSATALGIDLKGAATPVVLAFANGFSSGGNLDFVQSVGTDKLNFWGALPVLATSFLYLDYNAAGDPVPLSTKAPPQYGRIFDQTAASILQFGGAAASTVFLDDFGSTWIAQGAAKVQNTQIKFGTGALGGGGASNALDGATDFVKSSAFSPKVWEYGWSIRGWFYITALPAAAGIYDLANFVNAGGFGAELLVYNNAGTIKFGYNLSSNGTSNDIAALAIGTTTPAVNTWYFVELTFDKLAGKYRLNVNGTQEQSTTSALGICPTTLAAVGAKATGANFLKGYADKFEMLGYCQHTGGVAYTAPTASPSIANAGYASDFFSLLDWKLYSPSAASAAAAVNPTFIDNKRLYVGEADTDALAVLVCRPYAYQGYYEGAFAALPGAGAAIVNNHNIGTKYLKNKRLQLLCLQAESGYFSGDITDAFMMNAAASFVSPTIASDRVQIRAAWGSTDAFPRMQNLSTGAFPVFVAANWNYRLIAERGF